MKQLIKKYICSLASVWWILPSPAYSQADHRSEPLQAMKEVVEHYQMSKYLSFDVTYHYSAEKDPHAYLDSLRGSYRLNGNDYWYSLDSTEVSNYQGTCVLLFKEDHIMYLLPANSRKKNVDFLAAMDSLLSHMQGAAPVLADVAGERKVLFNFGSTTPYKSIEYTIDKSSGFITRIREVVKSDQLYDPSVRGKIEGEIPYAIVDMDFSNYRSGTFDDRQLDTARYFKKDGQQYITVAPYDEYKIFLGAPNL